MKSPALSKEQREILEKRGVLSPEELHVLANKTKQALGAGPGHKASCHSDLTETDQAKDLQSQKLVQLRRPDPDARPRP
jgi:phosphomethylpyrimidine synthase